MEIRLQKKRQRRTRRGFEEEKGVETAESGRGLAGILGLISAEAEPRGLNLVIAGI